MPRGCDHGSELMKLNNTLTRKTETLVGNDDQIKMYVCGITPYAPSHLGHAMCAVIFDVLRRYLEHGGFEVTHIQNFTDVDDKMIGAAVDAGVNLGDLAESNIDEYLTQLKQLNVLPASAYPRATHEIPKIIEIINGLINNDFAYELNGDVYFRVKNDKDYGKLSRRKIDDLLAGARLAIDNNKEFPGDFALWKSQNPGEPSWDSPWGKGRPGWHIECTAMAIEYLGETVDIHGGGQDLVFPHHENEIAQSESFTGVVPFSKFWIHNGTLGFGSEKMSKSLGNIVTIKEALEDFDSDTLRMFFLASHYRSPLIYSVSVINSHNRALRRLKNALSERGGGVGDEIETSQYWKEFTIAMDDDLNTPKALAVIFDLVKEINKGHDDGLKVNDAQQALREMASVLGFRLEERSDHTMDGTYLGSVIDLVVNVRNELREQKQYAMADKIRGELRQLGINIEDGESGGKWSRE